MYGILAQSVEHLTFNQGVGGSNPPCLMKKDAVIISIAAFFYAAGKLSETIHRLGLYIDNIIENYQYVVVILIEINYYISRELFLYKTK